MKFLFDFLDKQIAPLFHKGGKLERLYPVFELGDTFFRTPPDVTKGAPHIRDATDLKRVMIFVIYALLPSLFFGMWNAGHQYHIINGIAEATFWNDVLRGAIMVLPIVFTSYLVGGIWEVLFSVIRKHEINEGFLVTGMLFPLVLPPTLPLWQVAVGVSFGIVIGKEIFGGVGYNILNPALTCRAFLFFAYPAQISGDTVWVGSATTDAVTRATPLAVAAGTPDGSNVIEVLQNAGYSLWDMLTGTIPGCIGSTSTIAVLLGAIFLLITGIASWRVMLSGVLGVTVIGLLMNSLPAETALPFTQLPFYYHLVMGGFAFGIVFMATDPVSCASTNTGKWIYGFMIGALTVIIRILNPAYPEGVMLAILFMNVMAPLIDHFVVQAHIRKRDAYARRLNHA